MIVLEQVKGGWRITTRKGETLADGIEDRRQAWPAQIIMQMIVKWRR